MRPALLLLLAGALAMDFASDPAPDLEWISLYQEEGAAAIHKMLELRPDFAPSKDLIERVLLPGTEVELMEPLVLRHLEKDKKARRVQILSLLIFNGNLQGLKHLLRQDAAPELLARCWKFALKGKRLRIALWIHQKYLALTGRALVKTHGRPGWATAGFVEIFALGTDEEVTLRLADADLDENYEIVDILLLCLKRGLPAPVFVQFFKSHQFGLSKHEDRLAVLQALIKHNGDASILPIILGERHDVNRHWLSYVEDRHVIGLVAHHMRADLLPVLLRIEFTTDTNQTNAARIATVICGSISRLQDDASYLHAENRWLQRFAFGNIQMLPMLSLIPPETTLGATLRSLLFTLLWARGIIIDQICNMPPQDNGARQ